MNDTQLQAIGDRLRARHENNRAVRERNERRDGIRLLVVGLLGGLVLAAVLYTYFRSQA